MTTLTTSNAEQKLAGMVLRKASDMRAKGTFMILYAQGGAGKTTLASDVKKIGKTLLADSTRGADAIADDGDIDVVELTVYADFTKLTEEIKKGAHGYTNIIVENVCEIAQHCTAQVTRSWTSQVEIQEYGEVQRKIIFAIKEWRDIAANQGINVFFLMWDSDEKDERGVLKKSLAFSPGLRDAIPGVVTIIGHIRVETDPNIRTLSFAPGPKTVSKFRRAKDAESQKVPWEITYTVDNLPLADILLTMKGAQEWPDKKYPAKPKVNNAT